MKFGKVQALLGDIFFLKYDGKSTAQIDINSSSPHKSQRTVELLPDISKAVVCSQKNYKGDGFVYNITFSASPDNTLIEVDTRHVDGPYVMGVVSQLNKTTALDKFVLYNTNSLRKVN